MNEWKEEGLERGVGERERGRDRQTDREQL